MMMLNNLHHELYMANNKSMAYVSLVSTTYHLKVNRKHYKEGWISCDEDEFVFNLDYILLNIAYVIRLRCDY